jgi:hypothetical protein
MSEGCAPVLGEGGFATGPELMQKYLEFYGR